MKVHIVMWRLATPGEQEKRRVFADRKKAEQLYDELAGHVGAERKLVYLDTYEVEE